MKNKIVVEPVLDSVGEEIALGRVMLLNVVEVETGKKRGMIARLGLDEMFNQTMNENPDLKARFIKCSDELSSLLVELTDLLPDEE